MKYYILSYDSDLLPIPNIKSNEQNLKMLKDFEDNYSNDLHWNWDHMQLKYPENLIYECDRKIPLIDIISSEIIFTRSIAVSKKASEIIKKYNFGGVSFYNFPFYFKNILIDSDYEVLIFDYDATALIDFNISTFNFNKGAQMTEKAVFKDYDALSDRFSANFENRRGHGWRLNGINNLTLFKTDLDIFMIYRYVSNKPIVSENLKNELEGNCIGFYFIEATELSWT